MEVEGAIDMELMADQISDARKGIFGIVCD